MYQDRGKCKTVMPTPMGKGREVYAHTCYSRKVTLVKNRFRIDHDVHFL